MDADRTVDLTQLGLPADAAVIYPLLLLPGAASDRRIAELCDRSVDSVRDAFGVLNEAGLVSLESGPDGGLTARPVRPGPGLDMLVRRQEAELRKARVVALEVFETFQRSARDEPVSHLIEVLRGAAVHERISQLERCARAGIRGFDSPPYYADADANRVELDNLARGVRYRVVYAMAALERPDYLADNVIPSVDGGEEARTLPHVPVKLMIFDEDCAVVSPSLDQAGADRAALLVRPSSLLAALTGLFEMCWRAALPFDVRETAAVTPSSGRNPGGRWSSARGLGGPGLGERSADRVAPLAPHERRLLGLLAAGMGDDQAARALGVSRRTLFRYLEQMMARTGAANRFQLALHAVRNNWI
ncbi:MAG TPA: LuxR C-terminal-related transcriptional regulator [Pseudonocardiaceae bacterium]|nr:LuxR C-terminal-related transcriptional regulator [Pseudonocardiaceae bacterium]